MSDSKIVMYDNELIRDYLEIVVKGYEKAKAINIPFKVWKKRFLADAYEKGSATKMVRYNGETRVRYTTASTMLAQYKKVEDQIEELKQEAADFPEKNTEIQKVIKNIIKEAFVPEIEFDYPGVEYLDGDPIWFGTTKKGITIPVGPENVDLSKPYFFYLNDANPHTNAQGQTGSGKSVLIHNLVANIMLILPPWEVDVDLIDGKLAELHVYGRTVQATHCTVVAATQAKEFILDLFSSFSEENLRRQNLFSLLSVSSLKELREEYDLCVPQKVFMVDELLALLTAIRDTANDGNEMVGKEIKDLFSGLAKVATQGRNAGVHMFISSQDLGDDLDTAVAAQLTSGIVLQGGTKISNGCIGNDRGAYELDRLGICLCNEQRKSGDNSKKNVKIGIPYLKSEPAADGSSYLISLLREMVEVADKYNFKKSFFFYDASQLTPKREFTESLKTSKEMVDKDREIYQCVVTLGKRICYRNPTLVSCELTYRAGDGFIIDAKTSSMLKYMFNIIKTFVEYQHENVRVTVYSTSDLFKKELELEDSIDYIKTTDFPTRELNLFNSRRRMLTFDKWFMENDASTYGICCAILSLFDQKFKGNKELINRYLDGDESVEMVEEDLQLISASKEFINSYLKLKSDNSRLRADDSIGPETFNPVLVYLVDMQDCDDLTDSLRVKIIRDYLQNSAKVGIINVINSSVWSNSNDRWKDTLTGCCKYVLENSTVEIFKFLGLGDFTANVNTNSLVVHNREKKSTVFYTKNFGGI